MLNRRINSCRASIAIAGFIRLSNFSRRSRSMAARSRTSWLRAFHFAYLPQPIPSASSAEMIQTVMSVAVTRSIETKRRVNENVFFSGESSTHSVRQDSVIKNQIVVRTDAMKLLEYGIALPSQGRGEGEGRFNGKHAARANASPSFFSP
jgi:hypothetical protein